MYGVWTRVGEVVEQQEQEGDQRQTADTRAGEGGEESDAWGKASS